jgi:LexA-binding, inner membrane-associated putative hydrolase
MMGSTHAATGALAGVVVTSAAGSDLLTVAAGAVLCAGAALVSDLDHGNSCATLAHGPFTRIPSKILIRISRSTYRHSRTPWEKSHTPSHDPGGHRYLTHTGLFAIFAGMVAVAMSITWPSQMVVEFFLISFAIRGLCQALPGSNKIDKWPLRTVVSAAGSWALLINPILLGVIVTAGIFTHIAADSMTKAGVPVCWPIMIRGQKWCRLRTPKTITTGKGRAEPIISWVSMIGGVLLGLYLV